MSLSLTADPTDMMLKGVLDHLANPITIHDERTPLQKNH